MKIKKIKYYPALFLLEKRIPYMPCIVEFKNEEEAKEHAEKYDMEFIRLVKNVPELIKKR